jgi:hypothetical protein
MSNLCDKINEIINSKIYNDEKKIILIIQDINNLKIIF